MAKLYRLFHGGLERVPCEPRSLCNRAAYILCAEDASITLVTGEEVGRVDCAKVETLMDHIRVEADSGEPKRLTHEQLRRHTEEGAHEDTDQDALTFVMSLGHLTAQDYSSEPSTSDRWLWKIWEADGRARVELLCEAKAASPSTGMVKPLSAAGFEPTQLYLLLCDTQEAFLWIGNRAEKSLRSHGAELARNLLCEAVDAQLQHAGPECELVTVRAHMEPSAFKYQLGAAALESMSPRSSATGKRPSFAEYSKPVSERRNTVNREREDIERHRMASKVAGESDQKRPLHSEVERMTNNFMGTLGMIAQEIGDGTRGIKMALLDDTSAWIKTWCIKADDRTLHEVESDLQGCFESSAAYAVLFVCKAGAKAVLYLWIGAECTSARKAAVALQAGDILRAQQLTGATEQITVEEGRESQFFLAMFARRASPVAVLRPSSENVQEFLRTRPWMLCCAAAHTQLRGEASVARQCSANALSQTGLCSSKCYVCAESGERVRVILGLQAAPFVQEQCQQLALRLARLAGVATVSVVPWTRAETAVPAELRVSDGAVRAWTQELATRPRRLFVVSNTRRLVGAMFVEELGHGGTFIQGDLMSFTDSFIADSGTRDVFVFHGPQSDLATRVLATRVVGSYVLRIKAESRVDLQAMHIESCQEPQAFKSLFPSWEAQLQRPVNAALAAGFDPRAVHAMEESESSSHSTGSSSPRMWKEATETKVIATMKGAVQNVQRTAISIVHVPNHNSDLPTPRIRNLGANPMLKPTMSKGRRIPTKHGGSRASASKSGSAPPSPDADPIPPPPVASPAGSLKHAPRSTTAISQEQSRKPVRQLARAPSSSPDIQSSKRPAQSGRKTALTKSTEVTDARTVMNYKQPRMINNIASQQPSSRLFSEPTPQPVERSAMLGRQHAAPSTAVVHTSRKPVGVNRLNSFSTPKYTLGRESSERLGLSASPQSTERKTSGRAQSSRTIKAATLGGASGLQVARRGEEAVPNIAASSTRSDLQRESSRSSSVGAAVSQRTPLLGLNKADSPRESRQQSARTIATRSQRT